MRRTGRDEDGVAHALQDGVALHVVLLQQALAQLVVQVPALVVDRVVVRLDLLAALLRHFVEQVADLVCVAGVKDVPQRARPLLPLAHALLRQVVTPRLVYGFESRLLVGQTTLH